jgi:glycosyltransferase involved in cell wall biosynthesis
MRIVEHVCDFGLGGIQKAACVLADYMADAGHETWVFANESGPRLRADSKSPRQHVLIDSRDPTVLVKAMLEVEPDVIHFHGVNYHEPAIREVARLAPQRRPLVVSTPVFGRPPIDRRILELTQTCCVGTYAFYRMCKWLSLPPGRALDRGIAYVPLTPFAPPANAVSSLDLEEVRERRRKALGISEGAFVCGRIGRDDPSKWSSANRALVDRLLSSFPQVQWLSIGFPASMGATELANRWGKRFRNIPRIIDAQQLADVISSFDLQLFFSRYGECFASSISEAAGQGVPTIALSTPLHDNGQAEQIIDGTTGFIVGGVDGAIAATARLIADKQLLLRLRQSCIRHSHGRWHAKRVTRDLLDFYADWRSSGLRAKHRDDLMTEYCVFAATYRHRAVEAACQDGVGHGLVAWAGLPLVERWSTFVVGRALTARARRAIGAVHRH